MKLALLAVALNAAFAVAADTDQAAAAMAKLRGAAVASDSPEDNLQWDGVPDFLEQQPDYCDPDGKYTDCDCYKQSNNCTPKCCTKNKGSCPSGKIPGCDNPNCRDVCDPPKWPDDNGNRDGRCFDDSDCDSGDFCKFNIANCGNQGEGRCTEIPGDTACTMQMDEVCGCDGKTYSNECVCDASAVSIKHWGQCEIIDCNGDSDCNHDEYCQFNLGNCGAQGKPGICMNVPGPQACPMNYSPVCGCNDKTYSNECGAQSAGVSLKYYGECESTTCGTDDDCSSNKYCAYEQGICGHKQGLCIEIPGNTACTMQYHPVCGCDNKTYGNSCEASAAAVSIKYWGECGSQEE